MATPTSPEIYYSTLLSFVRRQSHPKLVEKTGNLTFDVSLMYYLT